MTRTVDGLRGSPAVWSIRAFALWLLVAAVAFTVSVPRVEAGCGCDKPPPPPGAVRPDTAYTGTPVSLFSPSFVVGQQYTVTFANGISGATATVQGQAVSLRDIGDGQYKPQLVIPLPRLGIGPTSIMVTGPGALAREVIYIADANFTVVPNPIAVPGQAGVFNIQNYQAAVGRDGTVYISLDVSNVRQPLVVQAKALGYALRFNAADVTFKNVQGYTMQRLVRTVGGTAVEPIPGMFVFPAVTSEEIRSNSDTLHYSRHEFETYFLQHQERQPHAVDPADPNWHATGSPHVDHNRLILAVKGRRNDRSTPPPGTTPAFTLQVKTFSLFYQGLVGDDWVTVKGNAGTDAFNPGTAQFTPTGDIFSNGLVTVIDYAVVDGSATGGSFTLASTATISGSRTIRSTPMTFMQPAVPAGIPDLGAIVLGAVGTPISQTIRGPGSFQVSSINLSGAATLIIDNSAGPVSLYVTGVVQVTGQAQIVTAVPNPERFAIYVPGGGPVKFAGNAETYGVVYAPNATVNVQGNGEWYGALVGKNMTVAGKGARVHYYSPLRGQ